MPWNKIKSMFVVSDQQPAAGDLTLGSTVMAFDESRQVLVRYGGTVGSGYYNGTFVWLPPQ